MTLSKQINELIAPPFEQPTELFRDGQHAVYWLGTPEDSAFRCNTFLITDGGEAILVDPGGLGHFPFIRKRVEQVVEPAKVTAMILCHQDPDIAGSMTQWLDINPSMRVMTSMRTNTLIPYYGREDYLFYNVDEDPLFTLPSGKQLKFIGSPFLHSPGAFTTWDETSGFLFSGDIWAAVDMDWQLVVEDFHTHRFKMDLFHLNYMAGTAACKGFLERLRGVAVSAILPQHGSIIPGELVPGALNYLERLKCGVDLLYPEFVKS